MADRPTLDTSPDEPADAVVTTRDVSADAAAGAGYVSDHPPTPAAADDASDRGVAILLAVAAMLAAWITFVAVNASGAASGGWQTALRQEVARGAGAVEAIRYVYGVEAPAAFRVTQEALTTEIARAAAASAEPSVAAALEEQAAIAQQLHDILVDTAEMARPEYALPDGGFDPLARLAASLAEEAALPDAPVRDPEGQLAAGDAQAARAMRLVTALVVVSLAFLAGALAQAWRRWRRPLLAMGWVALATGTFLALMGGVLG